MSAPPLRILLVDDDKNIRQTLTASLRLQAHEVTAAESAEEALTLLRAKPFDFLLTDFKLGGKSGISLLQSARQAAAPPVTVLMTAFASFENAVTAIKEGAYDYLPKPFSTSQLAHLIARIQELVELKRENQRLRDGACRADYFAGQTSPAMVRLEEFVRKTAPTEASILLIGESGTGKTELARLIHARSPRARRAFAVVNCTTLAESLLESELFGHAKGAFTGAVQEHVGRLESADQGTVLIDEVGDLSLSGQAKLLRFLQERVIERVGSSRAIPLDVRVIAATHRNLAEAVTEGGFREDLYFRLNVLECALVPLRHRREDLPVLIERFSREIQAREGIPRPLRLPPPIVAKLLEYSWPGNLRELRNAIERLVLLSKDREMESEDLPEAVRRPARAAAPAAGPFRTLEEIEKEQIERVLTIESNQERAAKILGITTVTLWRKRKEYGLP